MSSLSHEHDRGSPGPGPEPGSAADSLFKRWQDAFRRRNLAEAARLRRDLLAAGWTISARSPYVLRLRTAKSKPAAPPTSADLEGNDG
jgi:hypothetical protein